MISQNLELQISQYF